MKNLFLLLLPFCFALLSYGQTPKTISYQGVARNATGQPIPNQNVKIKLSLLETATSSNSLYTESHTPTTTGQGLFAIQIGAGTVLSGTYSNLDWSNGPKFVKTEIDPTGGDNFTLTSTNPLNAVPFALFAASGTPGPMGLKGDTGASGPIGPQGPAGTFQSGTNPGDIFYWTGSSWTFLPIGSTGQVLKVGGSGLPVWSDISGGGNLPNGITTNIVTPFAFTASSGGTILSDGGSAITARGICWSTSQNPTIANSKTVDGSGIGAFNSNITGLNLTTTYYVRAYATNSNGTVYGNQQTFITRNGVAILATTNPSAILALSATSGGSITDDGGSIISARGVCWATTQNPTTANNKTIDGSGSGTFSSNLTNLTANTLFYMRAYATNGVNTFYGNQQTFTSRNGIILLSTNPLTNITDSTVTTGGLISTDGGSNIIAKGICWSITSNPTTSNNFTNEGTGTSSFITFLNNLPSNTTYYIRAYATNSVNTFYGQQLSFKATLEFGAGLTDIEGNAYPTVKIGTQEWMGKNLATSKYSDGTLIPNVTDNVSWSNLTTGAWCNYNNDNNYGLIYGKIYNWHTITDSRKVCPIGWHVPTKINWDQLIDFLGGTSKAGGKLKQVGFTLWSSPNISASNSSLLTFLPGSYRYNGNFPPVGGSGSASGGLGLASIWWTSTNDINDQTLAFQLSLGYDFGSTLLSPTPKELTGYTRCIKD